MARFFDISAVSRAIALDAGRTAQAPFTVTNATGASIRGDAVVVPEGATDVGWFSVDRPSRHYGPGATEQVTVAVAVPADVAAGSYRFHLRMLLGGGVPEEEFDDGQSIEFSVEAAPDVPPPPPPPKRGIPWWLIALIVVIALVVIGVAAWLLWPRPPEVKRTVIDFGTPPLGAAQAQIRNPLSSAGVTFSRGGPNVNGVVGVVKNRHTSACVEPADDDHKLGTGVVGNDGSVGRAAFPIQAQFNPPLSPTSGPVKVSVQFQSGVGANFRLRLVGPNNAVVGETTAAATIDGGTCGFPGSARGRVTLTVETGQPVAVVLMEETSGGRVFVVDDFTFEPAP